VAKYNAITVAVCHDGSNTSRTVFGKRDPLTSRRSTHFEFSRGMEHTCVNHSKTDGQNSMSHEIHLFCQPTCVITSARNSVK